MENWQKIYSDKNSFRAEIVKGHLIENNIEAIIINKKDSAYQVFGEYEVHVHRENVLLALKLINDEIRFE